MPHKQNPTAVGSRVLWNALVGASAGSSILFAHRAQQRIDSYGTITAMVPIPLEVERARTLAVA